MNAINLTAGSCLTSDEETINITQSEELQINFKLADSFMERIAKLEAEIVALKDQVEESTPTWQTIK